MGGSLTAARATTLMQRGIALLDANTPSSLAESLACFDQAIGLRHAELAPGDHRAAWLLAASWMNRGDALTRLGGAFRLEEAVRSYDTALDHLRAVPPEADPLYRRRHALAWINRGLTLQAQGATPADEAVHSFAQGIAHLYGRPEYAVLLASARVNQGNSFLGLQPACVAEARACAADALELVAGSENTEPLAAETGLKARLLDCQAVALRLSGVTDPTESRTLVCAATGHVEAGLPLAGRWKTKSAGFADPLSRMLFQFGLAVYRRYQPHFLAEFVLDCLDAIDDPAALRSAVATLKAEAGKLPPDGFATLHTAGGQHVLEVLRALRLTEQRLRGIVQVAGADIF